MSEEKQAIISRALRVLARSRPYLEWCFEHTRCANPDWFELPKIIVEIDNVYEMGLKLIPEEGNMASATPAPTPAPKSTDEGVDFHVVELPITLLFPLTPKAFEWTWEYLKRSNTAIWMRQRMNLHHDDAQIVLEELYAGGFKVKKVSHARS